MIRSLPLPPLCALLLLAAAGCGKPDAPATAAPPFTADVPGLLARLTDPMTLPDLRMPGGRQVSSFDVTGGNNDWSHAVGSAGDEWVTLADLPGPGYVTRLWMTGWPAYTHPVEFRFDDEERPRLTLTVAELFGGVFPFQPPFARQENFCAYSNLPIPFAKRLVIRTRGGKRDGKFYFQVNHAALPAGHPAVSFPAAWGEREKAAWKQAAAVLEAGTAAVPPDPRPVAHRVELKPGETLALPPLAGPGVIRAFRCAPRLESADGERWQSLLRDVTVRIRWNGSPFDSVELNLGDFFGQPPRLTAYRALGVSFDGKVFTQHLPMPFREAAVTLVNSGEQSAPLDLELAVQPLGDGGSDHLGLLHASAQSTWPEDIGPTHAALRVKGRGKYVGGVLGIDSGATRSWWGLEGDEFIRWDDAFMPQWKGTGIEDHYNGGWYYRVPTAELLSGLLLRVPFQAVQYRWHPLDAPAFAQSIDVQFERGGENESPLKVESTAWFYLAEPAESDNSGAGEHAAPARFRLADERALAHHLTELERFGDYAGCRRLLRAFGPAGGTNLTLRLLDALYRERLEGGAAVAGEFAALRRDAAADPAVIRALDDRGWLAAGPTHALLAVASAAPVEVWYGGVRVGVAGPGEAVFRVAAPAAPVAVAVRGQGNAEPNFLHVLLESADRVWRSDDDWRFSENPADGWHTAAYDDSGWSPHQRKWLRLGTPPPAPVPCVDLYSRAENIIRPVSQPGAAMVYRRVWRPEDGLPLK